MTESIEVESAALLERVVLLGVVEQAAEDNTPVHAVEVRQGCADALAAVDREVVGTPTEAEVTRALNELEAAGLVTATREAESPSGKGRPKYRPAVDHAAILEALADDERVAELVERARD